MAKRPIKNVGLVVKRDSLPALSVARELSKWIASHHLVAIAEEDLARELKCKRLSHEELAHRADLIVVLGGDGTLLGIARLIGERETPILGINLGGLGFLTEISIEEARKTSLERVVAGDYEVDRRIMLEASVSDGRQTAGAERANISRALNDVVIDKRELGRMLDLHVVADHKPFCFVSRGRSDSRDADRFDRVRAERRRPDRLPDPARDRAGADLPAHVEQSSGGPARLVRTPDSGESADHRRR